ncbi:thiopeptide-type bacteriocin biosynthesis protein [Mucilaginibacter oryzae]|uniref:Thiopeptide-type bacteriocin biosynthesis protein n=1 Tax=Mucilaginibacter oryzae TaxID=468058 RepID=A0A316H1Z7_9SPHI|nr:lantibiotic dehydratase [Mucilaginibacter oryzae]PWK72906.1 thiopeptide-type bacteriocin biosynthesis protein [Mucilaginibacter oryzae]
MKDEEIYQFKEQLFLRAPFYSFEDYSPAAIGRLLSDRVFLNALFLASPVFYRELEKLNFDRGALNPRQQATLKKYFNRMSFRPTPFGAFSSFGLASWTSGRRGIKLAGAGDALLHVLPSREWIVAADHNAMSASPEVLLAANPTLYRLSSFFRYVRTSWNESGKAGFSVNELPAEPLNEEVIQLCRDSALSLPDLAKYVAERTDSSDGEALEYLNFLIGEQVLLTGPDHGLFASRLPDGRILPGTVPLSGRMSAFWKTLTAFPPNGEISLPRFELELSAINAESNIDFRGNPFYGGLERMAVAGGISTELQVNLLAAISVLRKIVLPYPTPALKKFMTDFRARFEDRRIPLLQAMDPDAGIGYGELYDLAQSCGILDDIAFSEKGTTVRQVEWTAVHRLFLRLWLQNTHRRQADPVDIRPEDVEVLESPGEDYRLPPTLAVMFTCAEDRIVLDNTGGASATSLTGRFSVFSREVERLCQELAADEREANPDVLFAELHQLSDTHVDNINRRMPLYDAVIDINTFPGNTGHLRIPLHDLTLRLEGGELLLESTALGKRIIPRLPTAYNFQHNPLAVFQFLCDLQYRGLQANLTFDLEKLFPGLDFYPRVVTGKVVLSLARWRLNDAELKELTALPLSIGRLHLFRAERGIPRLVSLGLSDQQLVFDLGNDEEAVFFLDCLKDSLPAVIREYLLPDRTVEADGKPLAAQMLALLKRSTTVYGNAVQRFPQNDQVQREFLPGSEWLYLKIYATPEAADRLLVSVVHPFLQLFPEQIRVWFFIRYQDPEPHLRLRVRSTAEQTGRLLGALKEKLAEQGSSVKDVKYEVYRRELERYSPELIEQVELLFKAGSEWVLRKLQEKANGDLQRSDLAAFDLVCRMAVAFLRESELPEFFKWRSESFLREFGGDKKLRVSLDGKYRGYSRELQKILGDALRQQTVAAGHDEAAEIVELIAGLSEASREWGPARRYALLADLLHMQVNRMFNIRQREHEALLFYGLHKACAERIARLKNVGVSP